MTVPTADRTPTKRSDTATGVYRQDPRPLPGDIDSFPFPFPKPVYRYSANVEPAERPVPTPTGSWGEAVLRVDGHYRDEIAEKRRILSVDPTRAAALPHMDVPQWDAMLALLNELALIHPGDFSLSADGGVWTFVNRLLGTEQTFVVGDIDTLPVPPLTFAALNVQEDIALLNQRKDALWGDALAVTFSADWSPHFDLGMSFPEIHGPVPRIHDEGIVDRAHRFIMGLQPGQRYRRTNWTLTVDGRLDTATETYDEWGRDRRTLADGPLDEVGDRLFLRVEVQHLIRLEWSGAVMFLIRTYLQPFSALARVPGWAQRIRDVLADLPEDVADYKGVTRTRPRGIAWLDEFAGTVGSPSGSAPPASHVDGDES